MITNQYAYNGDGQRVQIIDSQGTKKQIWDGENILLETDGADATQVVYTLEPAEYGNLVSQRRGTTNSYYLFDALGSTRKLTNSAGAVTDSYDFRAYGQIAAISGSTVNVFRWVGELGYYFDDDRDDYYIRARHYSPALARFMSQDPIGFDGSPWNLYEYVESSPISRVDSQGLASAKTSYYCFVPPNRCWGYCVCTNSRKWNTSLIIVMLAAQTQCCAFSCICGTLSGGQPVQQAAMRRCMNTAVVSAFGTGSKCRCY